MAGKRYFEFVDDSSNKFWEIWMDGSQIFTRYGKIGSSGQTTIKDEGAADKAQALHDKLVREKTGKGYEEKASGGAKAAAPVKRAPEPKASPPAASASVPAASASVLAASASVPAASASVLAASASVPAASASVLAASASVPAAKPSVPAAKPSVPAAKPSVPAAKPAAAREFRRFEFNEGGSAKFWEVKVEGSTQTIRYGKIGTLGQEKVKGFSDADGAQGESDKLIAEKTKKGYGEVAAAPSGPAAPDLDPKELQAHLDELPDTATDTGPFLVFADWLESKGHPWGKLIALQHGIATAASAGKRTELEKEEKALLREYGSALVGGLQNTKGTEFTWNYGFIRSAKLGSPTDNPVLVENLKTLLGLPSARMMDALIFDPLPKDLATLRDWDDAAQNITNPWGPVMAALGGLPDRVVHVGFGASRPSAAAAYVQLPDLKAVSQTLLKVQKLELTGSANGELAPLSLPELRSLEVRIASAAADNLQAIAGSKLPKLERLSVWLGCNSSCVLDDVISPEEDVGEDESPYPERFPVSALDEMEINDLNSPVDAAAVSTFLNAKFPTTLKHLGINSANLTSEMCDAILESKLLPQLETLDISGGTLDDETAKSLIKGKNKLIHLTELNVERNCLSKAAQKSFQSELPRSKVGGQRSENQPEFFFRYVATME